MGRVQWGCCPPQLSVTALFNSLCLLQWPFARPWGGLSQFSQNKPTKAKAQHSNLTNTLKSYPSRFWGSRRVQSPRPSQQLTYPSVPFNCVPKERTVEQWWNWALPCSVLVVAGGLLFLWVGVAAPVLPLSFWWAAQPLHCFACCTCDLLHPELQFWHLLCTVHCGSGGGERICDLNLTRAEGLHS